MVLSAAGLDLVDRTLPSVASSGSTRRRTPSRTGSAFASAAVRARLRRRQPLGRRPLDQHARPDRPAHGQGPEKDPHRLQHRTASTFAAGSVWVTSELDGTVRRISPKKNKVTATIKAGITPNGVVYAFGVALGRRPRRRQAVQDQRQDEQGRRSGSRVAEGGLDHAVAGLALGLERDRQRLPRQSRDRCRHRARRRRQRTRSARRGSTASSGCRTSTTERSRSSTRRRTRCARPLAVGQGAALDRRARGRRLDLDLGRGRDLAPESLAHRSTTG